MLFSCLGKYFIMLYIVACQIGCLRCLLFGGKALTKQRKKGRPPSENPMVHTAVVLPRDLIEQLKSEGAISGRGLSTEIRRRLHASFGAAQQPSTPNTDLLINLIKKIDQNLSHDASWSESDLASEVFKWGVIDVISELTAHGGEPRPGTIKLQSRYGSDVKAEIIGRTLARTAFAQNANEALRREFGDDQKK